MTFDIDKAMSDRFAKAGGAALVDPYDSAPEQNLPGLDYVNPDDPKEKYDNLSDYYLTTLHDDHMGMPFSSDLFQNDEVSDKLAGRQTTEDKDKEAERYIYDFVKKVMGSIDKNTRGRYFYENPPPESIRDAFLFERRDNLEDLLAQALRVGASDYIKNGRAKLADLIPQNQLVPDPSDVKSQAQADKVLAKKAKKTKKTEKVNKSADIDSRMKQWSAAGRAQHTENVEPILKSGTEKFQRIAPLPEGRDAASRAALFALIHDFMASNGISWKDISEFKDLAEPVMMKEKGLWLPGNDRYTNEMGALSAAREMEKQKWFNDADVFHMTNEKRSRESTAEEESQKKADNLRADVEKGKERAADSEGETQEFKLSCDIDQAMEAASQTNDTFDIQVTTKPRPDNRRR